jgi:hypothetical protein
MELSDRSFFSFVIADTTSDAMVMLESLSVSMDEVSLSGAWKFSKLESDSIRNVVAGKPVVSLVSEAIFREILAPQIPSFLHIDTFLADAKKEAYEALQAFDSFKAEDPVKRKNIVRPSFFEWPDSIDLHESGKVLETMGRMANPKETPEEMKRVLSTARLLKFLIEAWHSDEEERTSRRYIEGVMAERTILPQSWLRKK